MSVEHDRARERTDEEQVAVAQSEERRGETLGERARRWFGLDEPAANEPYPDDPERSARHRAAINRLRGSLAKQIARDAERGSGS